MDGKVIATNRVASHEYYILDRYEAGIMLDGGEIKSVRGGNCNLKDSFCVFSGGEIFVKNMHISVYDKSGAFNARNATRDRKLLLHKGEIVKLSSKVAEKGLTVVPLKLYFKDALVKMEIGLCQGKHTYDKKQSIKERDLDRSARRDVKNYGI